MRATAGTKALFAALLALGGSACIPLPRYPAVEPCAKCAKAGAAADETFDLDPWLLAEGLTERVVIEIDWVAGCKPGPLTVESLSELLGAVGPPGLEVDVRLDDEIPRQAWDDAWDDKRNRETGERNLVEKYAEVAGESFEAIPGEEWRYVLFVPGRDADLFGYSTEWPIVRGGERRLVRGVVVNRDPHARYDVLWISLDRLERMTLTHEFGHQLGLVKNRSHERKPPDHRMHCTGLGCQMSHPTGRVIVHNAIPALFNVFPSGYCKRCRADIRQAQDVWRRQLASNPRWQDGLVAARELEVLTLHISRLLSWVGREEELLQVIASARESGRDVSSLTAYEVQALGSLGRFDEALASAREVSYAESPRVFASLGRALIGAGRHEDAVGLFDREAMRSGADHEFENSFFVLEEALVGLGRYAEAADLVEELLSREHFYYVFLPGPWASIRADLLRRAGRLDEALAIVSPALSERKTRKAWSNEYTARILTAAGQAEEARAMRREVLEQRLRGEREANDEVARRSAALVVAAAYAALGESVNAQAALERAGPAPTDPGVASERWMRVHILARLGDLDRAAELLRDRAAWPPGAFDPCGEESLEPMLADARFADVVGHCPRAAHGDRP